MFFTSADIIFVDIVAPIGRERSTGSDVTDCFCDGFVDDACAFMVSVIVYGSVCADAVIAPKGTMVTIIIKDKTNANNFFISSTLL